MALHISNKQNVSVAQQFTQQIVIIPMYKYIKLCKYWRRVGNTSVYCTICHHNHFIVYRFIDLAVHYIYPI